MTEKLLGHCGVDSGQILMADPCYVEKGINYPNCCEEAHDNAEFGRIGVKLAGFGGDGTFPVYGKFIDGMLVSATIKFSQQLGQQLDSDDDEFEGRRRIEEIQQKIKKLKEEISSQSDGGYNKP